MANEFKHQPNPIPTKLTQTDWESIATHIADGQTLGDIIWFNGADWVRIPAGIPAGATMFAKDYGLSFEGLVTGVVGAPHFQCSALAGFGDNYFKNYWLNVVWKATGTGGAPQGEKLLCTGYTSVTGDFTVAAYSVAIAVGDKVLVQHPAITILSDNTPFTGASIAALVAAVSLGQTVFPKHITNAVNAGDVVVATAGGSAVIIDSIVVHAITAISINSNYVAVSGGAAKIMVFIDQYQGYAANLDTTDKEISWRGAYRLPVGATIIITLNGVAGTASNLQVDITYHPEAVGGILS